MTGNADTAYDGERQEKAARKVGDSWEAATGSRKHTAALGSAQTYTFWGHEDGPALLRQRSAEMFDAVSELLDRETAMFKDFEEKMHAAMTRFTGAQADMAAQSIRSKDQDQLTALLHRIGLTLEDFMPLPVDSGPSTTAPQSSPGGITPTSSSPATQTGQKKI